MSANDVILIVNTIGGWTVGIIVMMGIWKVWRES